MSKVICAHFRKKCPEKITEKITEICKRLEPDNILANEPLIIQGDYCLSGVMNPMKTVTQHNASILLGNIFEGDETEAWHQSNTNYPDGSYVLFRNNSNISEFVTDATASRTLWFYFDEDTFLAATSQRAIILFLESFQFNELCIPWVLSTGSLGPDHSWDKRISRVSPATAIILNKEKWEIKIDKTEIKFKTVKKSNKKHLAFLQSTINTTFKKIRINRDYWVLPLSGGYDSRGILYFMLQETTSRKKPKTITWGLKKSQHLRGNDANIAKKISKTLKVPNKYYHTDISNESLKTILDRFILMGEGRIDHIGGYMDGFKIWKTLFEDSVQGIIRGDEGFGWVKVSSPINVRYYNGCALCSDFSNLKEMCQQFDVPMQQMPSNLERKSGETLSSWRDRIYHEFRLPTILSALSDLKLGYVEQSTPLLSNNILNAVRELPDKLRTEKLLFKKIVDSLEPKIEYATEGANAQPGQILKHEEVVHFLKHELGLEDAKVLLPSGFLDTVIQKLKVNTSEKQGTTKRQKFIALLKRLTPKFIKNIILSNTPLTVDYNVLAFRIYIIVFMHRLLSNEYLSLKNSK